MNREGGEMGAEYILNAGSDLFTTYSRSPLVEDAVDILRQSIEDVTQTVDEGDHATATRAAKHIERCVDWVQKVRHIGVLGGVYADSLEEEWMCEATELWEQRDVTSAQEA